MMKINVDAYSYRVSDKWLLWFLSKIFLTMLVNIKQQIMKEQTIAVQLQSQMTCLCTLHYHLQQNQKLSS